MVAMAERHGLCDPSLNARRARRLYATLTVGLRIAAGAFWHLGWRTVASHVRLRVSEHAHRSRPVAGYVTSSVKENQVIRLALLLRAMGRREAGLSLLVSRLRSGLVWDRSRGLLAAWLGEIGEGTAAVALEEEAPVSAETDAPGVVAHEPVRLRYGLVVLATSDTDIFRASVHSLVASDYRGAIVVVEEGTSLEETCRAFCKSVGVTYVKRRDGNGRAQGFDPGVRCLGQDVDVVLSSHSDVLWPPEWFAHVDRVWDSVWDSGKVGVLNLGYLQIESRVDPMLTRLFVDQQYDDLEWMLRAMREVPAVCDMVQDIQVRSGEAPFGMARDPGIDRISDLRQQTGRCSVVASFPLHVWREIRECDADPVLPFDLECLHHSVERRRWVFFVNNPPVIHLKKSDTEQIAPELLAQVGTHFLASTRDGFRQKYGWHLEHFINLFFSESTVVHRGAILEAANAGRFDDIDFVFDDFKTRLAERTLDNCELAWCRTRAECPYG